MLNERDSSQNVLLSRVASNEGPNTAEKTEINMLIEINNLPYEADQSVNSKELEL